MFVFGVNEFKINDMKNCLGIAFLENLASIAHKNVFGIILAILSGWRAFLTQTFGSEKANEKKNTHISRVSQDCPGMLCGFCLWVSSPPQGTTPQKHEQRFATHLVPGQLLRFVFVYMFLGQKQVLGGAGERGQKYGKSCILDLFLTYFADTPENLFLTNF